MHVTQFTGKCQRVNQRPVKPWVKKVPLDDPGPDAKSLVAVERVPGTSSWNAFHGHLEST